MDTAANQRIEEILSVLKPVAIYLFGSTVTGRNRGDSDVDLAILSTAPLTASQILNARVELSEALGRDVDLIDLARANTVLRKEILVQGRLLHETDARTREEFEMYTLSDYARLNEERAPVLAALAQPSRRNA